MATSAHAQAVKCLNKSPGRRRFVFKTFSQRIEDIDINVYRSLDKIKSEPSEGSSFFRDFLVEWRELNTAEDFISFYEEMMPFVQTLPLVLLHKESILSKLLSRLQMKARLSLEPILRLIAALSRDLLEDFISFLPRIADAIASLLESGADREPEIVEQVFTSWSHIMMHLQKYLTRDIASLLKVTIKLRYYPRDYVQEFMAEATSFLLRNASLEQLTKGVRKIMFEVAKKPIDARKDAASSLLCYVMKGMSGNFHSKAERVLQLVLGRSIFEIGDKFSEGSYTVVDVVIAAFQRLCEELEPNELSLMWKCLYREITESMTNADLLHLSRLLSVLISVVQIKQGRRVPGKLGIDQIAISVFNSINLLLCGRDVTDYRPILELVGCLMHNFLTVSGPMEEQNHPSEVVDKVLKLMLCILDGLFASENEPNLMLCIPDGLRSSEDIPASALVISHCSSQWAPVFALRNSSLLTFIRELVQKDESILDAFRVNILSALSDMIETSPEKVVYLLLSLCERFQTKLQSFFNGVSEDLHSKVLFFLQGAISDWIRVINYNIQGVPSSTQMEEPKLAVLWGVISSYPFVLDPQTSSFLLIELIDVLDQLLMVEAENILGIPRPTWQSLIGAALSSHLKWHSVGKSVSEETSKVLHLAKSHRSSSQVLFAVAEYLDFVHGPSQQADGSLKVFHPELKAEKLIDTVQIFADNLRHSNKAIRVPTLRILCHFESMSCEISTNNQSSDNGIKMEVSQTCHVDAPGSNVLHLLLAIETTPLSIEKSRAVTLLISRIQMDLSAGRISETYIPLVLNAIIGIFHNRFIYLWHPASECLAVLIGNHFEIVWEKFVQYFQQFLSTFQKSHDQLDEEISTIPDKYNDIVERFTIFVATSSDSTPSASVLSLLLQSLQKVSSIVESRSRQIVPLFLMFLGYDSDKPESVGSFNLHACKGKEWRDILKEWLNLFKLMHNPKSFYRSQFLKDVMQNRLLDENDAEIQMQVIDCILLWKDDFLVPYQQHMKNLISSKNLREELTTWSLSKESHLIEENHRPFLVPLVIRLLMPKVRTLKTLASRKQTSIHHRKAVLGFITQLDVDELSIFFMLLIKPLQISLEEADCTPNSCWGTTSSMLGFEASSFLKDFSAETITALSWKKRSGFLHVIEDIIGVFDEFHIKPFLDLLNGCVVRILASCGLSLEKIAKDIESSKVRDNSSPDPNLDGDRTVNDRVRKNADVKQFKELRSLCLKVISLILKKYEDYDFGHDFWDLFFISVKPLIDGFKQEGSSSEKPSSLFSCFLAMSSSHSLAPLLNRENNLVPDVFSILTVRTASEAILSCVLSFILNLLNLDSEIDDGGSVLKQIILLNLDVLVCSLHCLLQGDSTTRRKSVRSPGGTEMRIFKLLSKYITQQSLAEKFVDILLPFLTKRVKHSEACIEAMQVIRDIVPVLGSETASKILNAVSPLLIYVELDMRLSICELLRALATANPSILIVANLVSELNAPAPMQMGDLDYDTSVAAYERIGVEFFDSTEEDHASVILSHCVYDMSSGELILRHSAYRALLCFVDFSARVLEQEVTTESRWTSACIHRVVNNILLKYLGNEMNKGSSVKKEWIDLLREMVMRLPQVEILYSLKALCSDDAEVDFFNNIVHLQRHKRAKALARFKKYIVAENVSEVMMNKLFIPFFFNTLFDAKEGKGENITTLCMEALASISSCIGWKSYYALLHRCFREMNLNPDRQKVLLKLICAILDQFHFFSNPEAEDCTEIVQTSGATSVTLQKTGSFVVSSEIQTCLEKTLLPKIQKLLTTDSDKLSVNISVAALKLLKLLPGDTMDSQLPSIIHRISNFLKSRAESIRNDARLALAACLKELGLEYLQFIVGVLQGALKRGFELHVLGYTLNFILSKALPNPMCGKLDYCLKNLLSVIEKDVIGEVADEKEVDKIASKMKETKTCKSFETLKLIAQSVTFKTHALTLVSSVTAHLQKHLTPKLKTKLESVLNHIAAGIQHNSSVERTDLFIFVYGLVEDGIKEENNPGGNITSTQENKRPRKIAGRKPVSKGQVVSNKSACSHLITVFALELLNNYLKNLKFDKNDEQLLSMLDPFVNLLGNCLSSKYEDVISASLKCLTQLLWLPLPSLRSHADRIKVTVLDIALNMGNSRNPLVESCLKLLIVLLRSTKVTLSSDQLRLLIQFPLFVDIERTPSFSALSLLKAVVQRKLVVPELFDIIVRVAELMVTSQDESIRKKCSRILLQFLRDYHLAEKRLEQHLDFLLANIRYEHSSGREAILEMLHAIIMKFPKGELDQQSMKIFVQLVVCLANDHDNKVQSMAGAAIKCLVERIDKVPQSSVLEYSLSWFSGEKQQLWSVGAQVLGLLVEAMKAGFKKHTNSVLPMTRRILLSVVDVQNGREVDVSEEATIPLWKDGYFSLVMLENIFIQFPNLILERDLEDIWEIICELLLHPHSWLRNISSRLVALYFENAAGKKSSGSFLLMKPSRLFLIAASACHQLKTEQPVRDAAKHVTQNLVSTVYGVHSLTGQEWADPEKLWPTFEEHEKSLFLKAFQLLGSRKGRAVFLSLVSGSQVQDEEEQPEDLRYLLVSNLLKKMAKICLDMGTDQMEIIFKTLEKLVLQWSQSECQRYAFEMLLPLYKACDGFAGKVISDEMIGMGQKVQDKIRDKLGFQEFKLVYRDVRKKVMVKRETRKQEQKVMAVTDPERNAKRKRRVADKHRVSKKHKLFTNKMGKWMR